MCFLTCFWLRARPRWFASIAFIPATNSCYRERGATRLGRHPVVSIHAPALRRPSAESTGRSIIKLGNEGSAETNTCFAILSSNVVTTLHLPTTSLQRTAKPQSKCRKLRLKRHIAISPPTRFRNMFRLPKQHRSVSVPNAYQQIPLRGLETN